jgi:hypothetical protein
MLNRREFIVGAAAAVPLFTPIGAGALSADCPGPISNALVQDAYHSVPKAIAAKFHNGWGIMVFDGLDESGNAKYTHKPEPCNSKVEPLSEEEEWTGWQVWRYYPTEQMVREEMYKRYGLVDVRLYDLAEQVNTIRCGRFPRLREGPVSGR